MAARFVPRDLTPLPTTGMEADYQGDTAKHDFPARLWLKRGGRGLALAEPSIKLSRMCTHRGSNFSLLHLHPAKLKDISFTRSEKAISRWRNAIFCVSGAKCRILVFRKKTKDPTDT